MTALSYSRVLGANDRVRMGYIGLGNRGDQVHDAFLEHGDAQTVAVCDLRDDYMDFAVKKSRSTPKKYKDYRKLLDDKDVDAVVIATPDHWHALMYVHACKAGKDVYVEKPFSLTVGEGRKMVQTSDARSVSYRSAFNAARRSSCRRPPILCVPAASDRSLWQGYHLTNEWPNGIGIHCRRSRSNGVRMGSVARTCSESTLQSNRTFYNFRWFYNYSGGQVTNFGVHYFDMLRWCLGQDAANAVTAMGGKYAVKDNREIPDTLEALWQCPDRRWSCFLNTTRTQRRQTRRTRRWNCEERRVRCICTGIAGKLYPSELPMRLFRRVRLWTAIRRKHIALQRRLRSNRRAAREARTQHFTREISSIA